MRFRRFLKFLLLFLSVPCIIFLYSYYKNSNPFSYHKTLKNSTAAVLVGDSIYIGGSPKVTTRLMYGKLKGEPKAERQSIGLSQLHNWSENEANFQDYLRGLQTSLPKEFRVWKSAKGKLFPRASYDNRSRLLFNHFLILALLKLPILACIAVWYYPKK